MRRFVLLLLIVCLIGGASLLVPAVREQARSSVRSVLRPEPPARITPMPLAGLPPVVNPVTASPTESPTLPPPSPTESPTPPPSPTETPTPEQPTVPTPLPLEELTATPLPLPELTATPLPTPELTATPLPLPEPTVPPPELPPAPEPVLVNGRVYDAYIPAAMKESQAYHYSCEFDAAWVIFQTYGFNISVDEMIPIVGVDNRIEPYIGEETAEGQIIYGGDITASFSGDYTSNFLARSSATAISKLFTHYGLDAWLVSDRAGVEAALRQGALVWMKTTVDFKPWRPAIWHMPDGRTHRTVLGNDHAVVVMGFNAQSVVIRDVLGPTSSNWERPYEYEVDWSTFLAAWEAQSFDGLAVARPQ